MSTRSVIARTVPNKGETYFEGRYHHWDGYPTGLGKTLWSLYHGHFRADMDRMLHFLLDEHSAGWSTIVDADFNLTAGFYEARYEADPSSASGTDYSKPLPHGPVCYCHGQRSEKSSLVVNDGKRDIIASYGLEWAYIFDEEKLRMYVLQARIENNQRAIGMFGGGPAGGHWFEAAVLELDGSEPDWQSIQKAEYSVTNLKEVVSWLGQTQILQRN